VIRDVIVILLLLSSGPVAAQTAVCEDLGEGQRRTAESILNSEYLYDCCDDTVSRCLVERPTCRLAVRIADDICRRVAAGQDEVRIRRALSRRARSMMGGGTPAEIDLSNAPVLGTAGVPVTVTIYACARCPYCSKLIPLLHDAVADGELAGQARIAFRIFPIRGHDGSTEAGLGFAAAAEMQDFWPFMMQAYRHFDEYSAQLQLDWAQEVGLDREVFAALLADPATREILVESKKEGRVNGVEETPTFFINGRRWVGDLEFSTLVDAIEEEAERIRGLLCADE
jgi:protein-disulfide isomerase